LSGSEKLSILLTRLGQAGEEIRREPKPEDIAPEEKIDYLSLMLVKNKPGGEK
jgi:precorrin-2/cobalt-factor-2 C20-methyltransferase